MHYLERVTTEYVEMEDRLRLTASLRSGKTISFWFTQRLLIQLLLACTDWLENQSPDIAKKIATSQSKDSALSLAQESAKSELHAETSVVASPNSPNLLVKELDINFRTEGIELVIKAKNERFSLILDTKQLRQWLSIIYMLWQNAKWPNSHWPDWMTLNDASPSLASSVH